LVGGSGDDVGVILGVIVGVTVIVGVILGVTVIVGVIVGVTVIVGVIVGVTEIVGVGVGVGSGQLPSIHNEFIEIITSGLSLLGSLPQKYNIKFTSISPTCETPSQSV
jgi:hypothetical protein